MLETITSRGVDHAPVTMATGKILLVDGDVSDLQFYASLLRDQGNSVDCCTTYEEGAERLESGWYDLIVLNQEGQSFEGQSLLERAIELDRHRPVLVLTRSVDMRSYLDAMYLGAHDYLEKPLLPWEINKMVSNCLSYRRFAV